MKQHLVNIEIGFPNTPLTITQTIESAALAVLNHLLDDHSVEVTVLVCDDEYMTELNRTYRGFDKTTDVLSFEDQFPFPDSDVSHLGDIAISFPTASQQAIQAKHDVETEICLLVIHGTLHLCGYDHDTTENKNEMWALQTELLRSLGCSIKSSLNEEPNV